jgi:hypothetical protein
LPKSVTVVEGRETPYPQIAYFEHGRSVAKEAVINSPWASVFYGPLLFALPIPDETPNRQAPNVDFEYALDLPPGQPDGEVRVIQHPMPRKWTWQLDSPLKLSVKVRQFDWRPTDARPLPEEPVKGGSSSRVDLVPYGCTKFRVAMFPVTEEAWKGGR